MLARRMRISKFIPAFSLSLAVVAVAAVILWRPSVAQAAPGINQVINFQGKVANANGTNVADGTYDFVFKMYNGASGSSSTLFTESWTASSLFSSTMTTAPSSGGELLSYSSDTHEATLQVGQILWNTTKKESVKITSVNTSTNTLTVSPTRQAWSTSDTITNKIFVKDGLFTASINSLNKDLSGVDFNSDTIYLGINFNNDGEMKPRIQYAAVPYAFNARQVNGLAVTNNGNNVLNIAGGKTLKVDNSLTFQGTDGKTLVFNNSLTFNGTDGTTFTLPTTGGTLCVSGGTCVASDVADDALDFDEFKDAMTLDAATSIALGSNVLTFTGSAGIHFDNTGTNTFAGNIVIGAGANTITLDPTTGITLAGTARRDKTLTLYPAYPNATVSDDGSVTTDGTMTTDNGQNAGSNGWRNYYQWVSTQSTLQDKTIMVNVTLPSDFDAWQTGSCPGASCALEFNYVTGTAATADNAIAATVNNLTDTPATAMCTINDSASTSWAQFGCTATDLASGSAPQWNSPDTNPTAVIRIKLKAKNTASAMARVSNITLRYKAKF